MFGKFFASTFTGSMYGAGPVVFSVWAYAIAHVQKSRVELNPVMLAPTLGTDVKSVEDAITYLCSPDPRSRSKEHDGRRLVREGEFQYFMPTHEKYRAIRNDDDRRAYFRQKKAEQRERERESKVSNGVSKTVKDCQQMSNPASVSASDSVSDQGESEGESQTVIQAEAIYAEYPRRVARMAAIKAIGRQLKKHDAAFLLEKTKAFACTMAGADPTFIQYPAKWFNQERFLETPEQWRPTPTKNQNDYRNRNPQRPGPNDSF